MKDSIDCSVATALPSTTPLESVVQKITEAGNFSRKTLPGIVIDPSYIKLNYYFIRKLLVSEYLCSPEANVFDIDFVRFKIRDWESDTVLFEIAKPTVPPGEVLK